ncbi:MAG: winged helix-turn-helix transcriptional regulator [Candidatus Omnitrophota bacterium]
MLDKKDIRLLAQLQDHFPLDPQPYAVIAKRLHLSPDTVLRKVSLLRKKGIIRYIGAVIDTKRIGLKSSLVAMAVPSVRVKEVGAIINSYPEVTHNYLRDDEYNMWFTISSATDAKRAALIRRIRRDTGIVKCLDLSTINVFKINARFSLDQGAPQMRAGMSDGNRKVSRGIRIRIDRQVLAALAMPLDGSDRPFRAIALRLGCSERTVTQLLAAGLEKKLIRRFGAVLDHYKIGLKTNALVAWRVSRADIASVAKVMCRVPNISHCYWRREQPGWPYTLYTMVHSSDRRQCRAILTLILRSIGHTIESMKILFTVRELKKTRFNAEGIGAARC